MTDQDKTISKQLQKVEVVSLFDQFDYLININADQAVTILYGINGSGKTTILRGINAIMNQQLHFFRKFPFQKFLLHFTNFALGIEKSNNRLRLIGKINNKKYSIELDELALIDNDNLDSRSLRRILMEYFDNKKIDILEFDQENKTVDVIDRKNKEIKRVSLDKLQDIYANIPDWYKKLTRSIPSSYYIREQRLIFPKEIEEYSKEIHYQSRYERRKKTPSFEVVPRHSRDLRERISSALTQYANQSQSLDRSFPLRLFQDKEKRKLRFKGKKLAEELASIDERRKQLQESGLLEDEEEGRKLDSLVDLDSLDKSYKEVLMTYIEDNRKKLSEFNDLYERATTFQGVINNYFRGKQVSVNREKGFAIKMEGMEKELSTNSLSSGEKNMLVMTYELIFNAKKGSIVLIDEPEISLHIEWQEKLVRDLVEMGKINDLTFILATHSPMIINNRWDLAFRLSSSDNDT